MTKVIKWLFLRHWKATSLVLMAVLVLASGVYAFWQYDTQPSSTPYSVAVSPPLELRLELDKTQFQRGETIVLRLFLKNIGDQNITIHLASIYEPPLWGGFVVKYENDSLFYKWPELYYEGSDEFVINSGEQTNRVFEWSQLGYERDDQGTLISISKLASSGTYKIIGRTEDLGVEGIGLIKMETPSVAITIA